MVTVKKGDLFSCEVCGLIVAVDEIGLDLAEISCCKMDMTKGKPAAEKAKKKGLLAAAKAPAKIVKAVAVKVKAPDKKALKRKAAVKKAVPAKPAAKAAPKSKAVVKKAVPAKPAAKKPVKAKKKA